MSAQIGNPIVGDVNGLKVGERSIKSICTEFWSKKNARQRVGQNQKV